MADNIQASVGDQAGIPDGTTYATREADTGSGPAHSSIVIPGLGYVNPADNTFVFTGGVEGTHDHPNPSIIPSSGPVTADQDSITLISPSHKGVFLWLDVISNPGGAETLSIELWAPDPQSANPVKLYNFGVIGVAAANATYAVMLYPGAVDADFLGKALAGILPYTWFVRVVHSAAGAWDYSLSATLLA